MPNAAATVLPWKRLPSVSEQITRSRISRSPAPNADSSRGPARTATTRPSPVRVTRSGHGSGMPGSCWSFMQASIPGEGHNRLTSRPHRGISFPSSQGVPARSRWQVQHGDVQAGFCGERGQLGLPQPQPGAVGPAGISGDQQPPAAGVGCLPDRLPPAADRGDGERAGVVVGADVDPAGVRGQVVDPVGHRLAQLLISEVMDADPLGLPGRRPFRAAVLEVPDVLLLLGVHADHRAAAGLERGTWALMYRYADVGIAVLMLTSGLCRLEG